MFSVIKSNQGRRQRGGGGGRKGGGGGGGGELVGLVVYLFLQIYVYY